MGYRERIALPLTDEGTVMAYLWRSLWAQGPPPMAKPACLPSPTRCICPKAVPTVKADVFPRPRTAHGAGGSEWLSDPQLTSPATFKVSLQVSAGHPANAMPPDGKASVQGEKHGAQFQMEFLDGSDFYLF